jgi:formate dehydrogenase major subunit
MDGSTCKFEELLSTDVIVLIGTDLMNEHASLGVKVRQAQKQGAKTIVISDAPQAQEAMEADLFIQSSDTTALKAILKALAEGGKTAEGLDTLLESLADVNVEKDAKAAADMLMAAKKAIVVAEQTRLTTEAAKAAADIAVLSGHIGAPRDGFIQIKSNVNAQGLSNLGISSYKTNAEVVENGSIQGMFIVGEDVAGFDRSGMEFVAVADIYMTETAKAADAVLPLISLVESAGTVTACDGAVNEVKPAIPALGLKNWEVIQGLANAMGKRHTFASEAEIAREMKETHAVDAGILKPVLQPVADAPMYEERMNTNVVVNRFHTLLKEEGILCH